MIRNSLTAILVLLITGCPFDGSESGGGRTPGADDLDGDQAAQEFDHPCEGIACGLATFTSVLNEIMEAAGKICSVDASSDLLSVIATVKQTPGISVENAVESNDGRMINCNVPIRDILSDRIPEECYENVDLDTDTGFELIPIFPAGQKFKRWTTAGSAPGYCPTICLNATGACNISKETLTRAELVREDPILCLAEYEVDDGTRTCEPDGGWPVGYGRVSSNIGMPEEYCGSASYSLSDNSLVMFSNLLGGSEQKAVGINLTVSNWQAGETYNIDPTFSEPFNAAFSFNDYYDSLDIPAIDPDSGRVLVVGTISTLSVAIANGEEFRYTVDLHYHLWNFSEPFETWSPTAANEMYWIKAEFWATRKNN